MSNINDIIDSDNERKIRSKISRACDECRRKKIKCDSNINKPCTNCFKNNDICQFQRIQLKRGPSKGYRSRSNSSNSNHQVQSQVQSQVPPQVQPQVQPPQPQITLPPINQINNNRNSLNQNQLFWKAPSSFNFRRNSNDSIDSLNSNVISDSEESSSSLSLSPRTSFDYSHQRQQHQHHHNYNLLDIYYNSIHLNFPLLLPKQNLLDLINNLDHNKFNGIEFFFNSLELLIKFNDKIMDFQSIQTINQLFWQIFQIFQINLNNDDLLKNLNYQYFLISSMIILNYLNLLSNNEFNSINLQLTNIVINKLKVEGYNFIIISILNSIQSISNNELINYNILQLNLKDLNSIELKFGSILNNFNQFKLKLKLETNFEIEMIRSKFFKEIYQYLIQLPQIENDENNNIYGKFQQLIIIKYKILNIIHEILIDNNNNSKKDYLNNCQLKIYECLNIQLIQLKSIIPINQNITIFNNLLINELNLAIKFQQIFLNVFKINSDLTFIMKISNNFNDLINLINQLPQSNNNNNKSLNQLDEFFVKLNHNDNLNYDLILKEFLKLLNNIEIILIEKDFKYGWL
ncbi:hypothetical protein WICMUC_000021 [Wickerhamomyces mucosus]|uniref:Zn(2)-C6 fungal-type domain-containing protein n=1 Tax=Wickerhamomyces mucosus TaxID=1378264 RepID=A0A9P8Q0M5_9ASCO|nr:hypothetical protein WICMUC_000021 [Wickerhamomyces mucosus]